MITGSAGVAAEQAHLAPPDGEVAKLVEESKGEEKVSQLLIVVVVKFIHYQIVERSQEALENIAAIVGSVTEIDGIVEDVRIDNKDDGLAPARSWLEFQVVADQPL